MFDRNTKWGKMKLHYIAFYLADAFIQSDVQSRAIQGHTTTEDLVERS